MGITAVLVIGGGSIIACAIACRKYFSRKWGSHDVTDEQDVKGKIIIITGANDGLGKETTYEMYKRGAIVIMACRNLQAARATASEIRHKVQGSDGQLIPMMLDLASFDSVRQFVQEFQKEYTYVNILINNAGVYLPHGRAESHKTIDGYEIHFQVNYLSHFLLTILLIPNLRVGAPSRIVNVASTLYEKAEFNLDDINLENLNPSQKVKMIPYSNSKLANVLFSRELANRIKGHGIHTYALCPGWVKTSLGRNAGFKWYHYILMLPVAFLFMRSTHQGCQTILHCALSNACGLETGKLYRNCDHWIPSSKVTETLAKQVWEVSEKIVDVKLQL